MRKIWTLICFLVAACMGISCAFLVGCKGKPDGNKPYEPPRYEELPIVFAPENCEVIAEDTLFGNILDCNGFIAICGTYEELEQECLKNGYDFFDSDDRENNLYDSDAGKIIRGFTDEDFADKALVVCAIYCPGFDRQYLIEEVEVAGNELTLKICYPSSGIQSQMINVAFLIAAVDKSYISEVSTAKFVTRGEKIKYIEL